MSTKKSKTAKTTLVRRRMVGVNVHAYAMIPLYEEDWIDYNPKNGYTERVKLVSGKHTPYTGYMKEVSVAFEQLKNILSAECRKTNEEAGLVEI